MKSLYALIAVGLDAARIAFSKSKIEKKAVSAAVAAVVGVGLLCSPIESVQAQGSGMPEVTHLYLFASHTAPYIFTYAWVDATAGLDISYADLKWREVDETLWELPGNPQYPDGYLRNGYFALTIMPRSQGRDYIDVFFYVGLDGFMSAWVEDSDGNEYTVDVTMLY